MGTPTRQVTATGDTYEEPTFLSSFDAFNLPHRNHSHGGHQLVDTSTRDEALNSAFKGHRRQSTLGHECLMAVTAASYDEEGEGGGGGAAVFEMDADGDEQIGVTTSMRYSGPTTTMPISSPVTIARSLQRTPPPFLQRKLYGQSTTATLEDDSSTGNSSSTSASSSRMNLMSEEDTTIDGEERNSAFGLIPPVRADSPSVSGGEEGRVVRRPVSRKPNLLPKPKSHLRVLSQLRAEDGPADQLEIVSEAALHRLSRSGAGQIPRSSGNGGGGVASSSTSLPTTSTSGVPPSPFPPRLRNRFPEQADEEDERSSIQDDGSSADEDIGFLEEAGDGIAGGSDYGMSGYGTEEEEENRRNAIWGIRGSTAGNSGVGLHFGGLGIGISNGKSPGSERGRNEVEMQMHNNSPSSPSWHPSSNRAGKRKMQDDRFEPYAQAFKRRAVSPASSTFSPSLGSPILSFASSTSFHTPPPQSTTYATGASLPIPIPSPTLGPHLSFFSSLNYNSSTSGMFGGPSRSRAGSPVPSSLGSSAGRSSYMMGGIGGSLAMAMSGRAEREELEKNAGKEVGDGMGKMMLG